MPSRHRPSWIPFVRVALPLLVIAVVLLTATDVMACPTCKDGLAASDPVSQAQARGFFYSILFMMAMPFVILGTFGSAAYWSIRKAREQQDNLANREALD
ncbi:MAG: hypothetical protein GXP24_12645 [Planctomycetes bacterium]|nr:hypothetical protein [Planctomycetota bacterium]